MTDLTETSKFLALVLRHRPSAVNIELDEHGWADVPSLLEGVGISMDDLEEIVRTDEKGRYSFNDDHTLIRANQGHSIRVDVELEKVAPPVLLYHGTAKRFIPSIREKGILRMSRLYVHMTDDKRTALRTGARHGDPVVLGIRSGDMHDDGYDFFRSANGVWLTKEVPPEYILVDPIDAR